MTFTYTFDDRDENGPDLTIEIGTFAGSPACRYNEYPAEPAEWWLEEITDDDGNKYDEEFFTAEEWQRILNAAETALEGK